MKTFSTTLFAFVTSAFFYSCSTPPAKESAEESALEALKKPDTSAVKAEFPSEELPDFRVLYTGSFHNEEVPLDAPNQAWIGLFKGAKGHFLKAVHLTTKQVYDPVVDENESQQTGWEVSTDCSDSCIILMEPTSYLKELKVDVCALENTILFPNETMTVNFKGTEYTFWAKGIKQKAENGDWYEVRNYRIYLTAMKDGKLTKTLLLAHAGFSDYLTEILFAGDIDGDGKLDLIINTSNHYNVFVPTVYLSKPAKNNELVTPVGGHVSVGC